MPSAAVFGKGRVSVLALRTLSELGYEIAYVVPTHPHPEFGASLIVEAQNKSIDILNIQSLDELPETKIDLGISVYFNKIFKQRHIDKYGMLLNVHNAPLPRNRGVLPVNWALHNEEREHGVTLHVIEEGIDVGPIVSQRVFPIDPELDEVEDVYSRCLDNSEIMLTYALPRLEQLPLTPQDEQLSCYHHKTDFHLLGTRKFWRREHECLIEPDREL